MAHFCMILGVEMFHQLLDRAEAGDQVGVLIKGVKRDDIRRGQVIAKPGSVSMANHFKAQVPRNSMKVFVKYLSISDVNLIVHYSIFYQHLALGFGGLMKSQKI